MVKSVGRDSDGSEWWGLIIMTVGTDNGVVNDGDW